MLYTSPLFPPQHSLDPAAVVLDVDPVATCRPSPYTGTGISAMMLVMNSGMSFSGNWYGP